VGLLFHQCDGIARRARADEVFTVIGLHVARVMLIRLGYDIERARVAGL
jgi:hypothetical protein